MSIDNTTLKTITRHITYSLEPTIPQKNLLVFSIEVFIAPAKTREERLHGVSFRKNLELNTASCYRQAHKAYILHMKEQFPHIITPQVKIKGEKNIPAYMFYYLRYVKSILGKEKPNLNHLMLMALRNTQVDIAKFLINNGANPNFAPKWYIHPYIVNASENGNDLTINMLLDAGAKVPRGTKYNGTDETIRKRLKSAESGCYIM